MRRDRHADDINTWWERVPGERYWLDVTDRDGRDKLLAAPRGEAKGPHAWARRLITHVQGGDVVFHYDALRQAIVAWSISRGQVERTQLWWPLPAELEGDHATSQMLPSWGIGLRQTTELGVVVPLHDIARVQWSLFPSLRALEDRVGDPLYYPFEMGNREATRPLSGYVFKLPAVFVQGFPELASVAARVAQPIVAHDGSPSPSTASTFHPQAASR